MIENRQEWLEWRQKGLGSSDAPIIMNVSPYKTALKLWEEKTASVVKEDTSNQYIKDKGNEFETKVRALFEMIEGESFAPCLVQSADYDFLRASLDGRTEDKKAICEIKLSGRKDWDASRREGKVPDKYWPQVQHALMVSGADYCWYLSYLYEKGVKSVVSGNLVKIKVLPDPEYQKTLFEKEAEFWECVKSGKPPKPSDKDFARLAGVTEEVKTWKLLCSQIKELEKGRDQMRDIILQKAQDSGRQRLKCDDVRIVQRSRVGSVQYRNIPELQGVDIDKYRGKASVYWEMDVECE